MTAPRQSPEVHGKVSVGVHQHAPPERLAHASGANTRRFAAASEQSRRPAGRGSRRRSTARSYGLHDGTNLVASTVARHEPGSAFAGTLPLALRCDPLIRAARRAVVAFARPAEHRILASKVTGSSPVGRPFPRTNGLRGGPAETHPGPPAIAKFGCQIRCHVPGTRLLNSIIRFLRESCVHRCPRGSRSPAQGSCEQFRRRRAVRHPNRPSREAPLQGQAWTRRRISGFRQRKISNAASAYVPRLRRRLSGFRVALQLGRHGAALDGACWMAANAASLCTSRKVRRRR